jgi:catechol-2,3-dioxygenase
MDDDPYGFAYDIEHDPRVSAGSIPKDARESVHLEATALHHSALEIDKGDFDAELTRLQGVGVHVTTSEHRWCRWRSLYVHDPEGNILERVCYDESID